MIPGKARHGGRELFVRHARKDGRSVAVMRAVDHGDSCIVEAEVFHPGSSRSSHPGPYTFGAVSPPATRT